MHARINQSSSRQADKVRHPSRTAWLPNVFSRRVLLSLIAGAVCLLSKTGRAEAADKVGSVEEVKGEAFAEVSKERRALARGAPVFLNYVVSTGSDARLTMHLGQDTTLRVGQLARLTIDRYLVGAGGDITLETGPILYDSAADHATTPMQIHSFFGLIAVRGTRFFAGPSAGVFGVFVERGSVSVSAAGTEVILEAGQGSNIAHPGDAPTRPAAWGAQRIHAAMESVQ